MDHGVLDGPPSSGACRIGDLVIDTLNRVIGGLESNEEPGRNLLCRQSANGERGNLNFAFVMPRAI
jgi:hypothetical protein